jgi:hypothetical protein
MDLVTLVTACALTVGPKIMHALIWHQSGGEPWSFTVPGERQPQVYRTVGDAVRAAHATYPDDDTIRVGLTGLLANPQSVSAVMFALCPNITVAAGQISQLTERCGTSPRIKGDPTYCAILAYCASWERLDNAFADAIRTSVANIAPEFEMPDAAGSMPLMSGLQFSLTTPKRHRRSHRTIASGAGRAPSSGPSPGRSTVRRSGIQQETYLQLTRTELTIARPTQASPHTEEGGQCGGICSAVRTTHHLQPE